MSELIANPHRGEMVDVLAGEPRLLRLSIADISRIEDRAGKSLFDLNDDLANLRVRFDVVTDMLALATKTGSGESVGDMEKFRDACQEQGIRSCTMILLTLIQYSLHGAKTFADMMEQGDAAAKKLMGSATPPSANTTASPSDDGSASPQG